MQSIKWKWYWKINRTLTVALLCYAVSRFLRHVPVVYVDYPGPASLTQIYGTFNRAMLRLIPSLRTYAEPLTAAMVEFYTMSQVKEITKYLYWNQICKHQVYRKVVYKHEIRCMFYWSLFSPFIHIITNLHISSIPFSLQERFTQDTQPHYIYSPREMTRWVRGIFEALRPLETLPVEGLIRIWAHEALRLFQDRWVQVSDRLSFITKRREYFYLLW